MLPQLRAHLRGSALCAFGAACLCLLGIAVACSRTEPPPKPAAQIVLYTSMDDELAKPLIERFEGESGIRVLMVGDTEATKTTGLVQRLIAEKDRPRCDVWWSSEVLGTIRLEREGVLAPSPAAPSSPSAASSPSAPGGGGGRVFEAGGGASSSAPAWFSLAARPRVIAFSTSRLGGPGQPLLPASIVDLTNPAHKGRIGIARPQFGTTRGHMAALRLALGAAEFEKWLTALHANGVRLYDGNARVVRAIADGEIDIGLTDSDDAAAAKRNGWAIEAVRDADHPVSTPITVARVRAGPNAADAERFIAFLRSFDVVRALVEGETAAELVPDGAAPGVDWPAAAALVDEALATCERVLGR
ncbi:MAG: substrate-binding domain-containing protein [Phycisphaerales bacterium]